MVHVSVRQYSLYNHAPWMSGKGGPIAEAGFGATETQVLPVAGFSHNRVTL